MREQSSIEFYRDAAARFQLHAEIEPWPNLRAQYRQLAALYLAHAAVLERLRSEKEAARRRAA
jgi:hypothetical protein